MALRFGTDGVRGEANTDLTPASILALGRAAARALSHGGRTTRLLIGRDPRRSGPMLEHALAAGVLSEGLDVELLGVVPTPAVAHLAAAEQAPAAMISASHNPFADNGVKIFGPGGRKLGNEDQRAIEAELDRLVAPGSVSPAGPTGASIGSSRRRVDALDRYAAAVVSTLDGRRLDGLRVVLDCANGAASVVAPRVVTELGATVTVLHAEPDGTNINAGCGSTYPSDLQAEVLRSGADIGLAFDGDADRLVAVDGAGQLVDGDPLLVLFARDLAARGLLRNNAIAVTVMSNLGLRKALQGAGIGMVETPVGDRHVLDALDQHDLALGGEQSGHLIFRDLATTGDGLLSGVLLLDLVARAGRTFVELSSSAMTRYPQVLHNVRLAARPPDLLTRLTPAIEAEAATLGERGRVLVRPSGTEPVVRVMVEALDATEAEAVATRLVTAVSRAAES